ncbi:MAG: large repetitive protein, partial [Solirubrobacteraceae bacterium]|nr:large repetitive protein [Solirubrobacteraceae bacterium]
MKRLLLACVVLACLPATAAAQDTTAPHTTMTLPAPRITFVYQPFSVEFEADEPATFECRTFDGPWTPCTSPRQYANETYPGEHLYVRATDLAGNVETTPAHTRWTANQLVADVRPMIRGALEPGRPLSCSDAQWPSPVASAPKEWHRSGTGELLGTGDNYTVTTADLDLQMYCSVSAVKDGRTITTTYSAPFPEVVYKALPPSSPCVSSTADGGQFDDPIEPALSPDIFSASADTDDRCGLEVTTTVDHMWSTQELYSYVDSDGNAATGDTD